MFSKINTTGQVSSNTALPSAGLDVQAAPAQPAASKAQITTLAADLVFEGSITGEGALVVEGAVKGDIHVSRVLIGEHAHVEGTVRAAAIEVRGRVIGNIEGKTVKLLPSAHMEGDITHEQLSIEIGAFFQGRCWQFRGETAGAHINPSAEVIPLEPKQT